jgi:hypothetical protein
MTDTLAWELHSRSTCARTPALGSFNHMQKGPGVCSCINTRLWVRCVFELRPEARMVPRS